MNAKRFQKIVAAMLSVILGAASCQLLYGYQATTSTNPGPLNPAETAQQTPAELQALVAPIALYPDALVAQILTASTFPDQVAVAAYWLDQNKSLTGSALMQAVDTQSWDPSVKALTQFPSVLENLSKNLTWTSSLGEAYHDQQADVMAAIQTLRAKAKAAGNLKTTPQVTVVQQSPQVIVIQPTNPQIVYVPQYNPTVVYGTPYVVPGYSGWDVAAAGIIGFGAGIAVGAMMSGGCCSWGYSSWNCGWHGTAVVYHGGGYYGNSAWHGGYYNGGYHGSYGYNNYNHYNNSNYNHYNNSSYNHNSGNTYNRNVSGNTVNMNKQSAQNFASDRSGSSSWANHGSSGGSSNAFSGMSGHSGGSGGWSSRAESSRGWGSMRSSGFGGGRFGGGGGGFGGGGFRR
ncbi:MAG TPA: DUF3300 domain-containing protein [Candidatus Acidoferrum sp.]|jgi:hypothetical protein